MKILVTGGKGQLASSIKDISKQFDTYSFFFPSSKELDITNKNQVIEFFKERNIEFCVNCAAYTAVDKAEEEVQKTIQVNEIGAKNLAEVCKKHDTTLIHISTDFVFDGRKQSPYLEDDVTNPLGVYGKTKLNGEKHISTILKKHVIIRTSWLYSQYGNNFLKTMLRLASTRDEISVVNDQIGTPTYAGDLAEIVMLFVTRDIIKYGIYHYSNEGIASWYDFAKTIFDESNIKTLIKPILTIDYPTPAKRPSYSVLNSSKISEELDIKIPHWKTSLKKAVISLSS
ncbi:dTDP-4-dehydrorhamnose reductase [Aquimarina sp. ERC-38]|uniref:dTDP-4-dehydrorhamnose reductase n=1 Tax=Aquimarina sp. ERC-38 TaxID=2949996 RepID=UPI002245B5A8|nr:dTDP-4-dehydrorhamnose reductase [Aquimarina sp. ERC-38]UZO81869.1 dTDP-4-dehydrorhamnose reductase [Aquimarina sp. ERC-38]